MQAQTTVVLLVLVALLAVSVSSQSTRRPVPTCQCKPCSEPSITHTNCERLGGTPVHSYCNSCDTCKKTVGEGASCQVTPGDFPYPECDRSEDLTCVNNVCRKN